MKERKIGQIGQQISDMASLLARFIQYQYRYQYFIFESPGLYKVDAWILSQELRLCAYGIARIIGAQPIVYTALLVIAQSAVVCFAQEP